MTAREWLTYARQTLERAGVPDPRVDVELLLCNALNISRGQLFFHQDDDASAHESALSCQLKRRITREPLQHILGLQPFMAHEFRVDARALIPRFDTELLCECALNAMKNMSAPRILDLGTGAGVLAISLALARPDAAVTATDISNDAIVLARENAHNLGARVNFVQSDWWALVVSMCFDLVVSNPPYIPTGQMPDLQPEVLHDPRLALDGGADGLDCYREISDRAHEHIVRGGKLLMEVGVGQALPVVNMLTKCGETRTHRDLQGIERVVEFTFT